MLVDGSFPSTFGGLIPAKFVMCYDICIYHSSTTSRFRSTGGAGKLGIANLLDVVVGLLLLFTPDPKGCFEQLAVTYRAYHHGRLVPTLVYMLDCSSKLRNLVIFTKDFVHCELYELLKISS